MTFSNILIAIHAANELLGLVQRAIAAGQDITDEQLAAALKKADEADAAWAAANERSE